MFGIYPNGGVPCAQTNNAACDIPMKNGCEARYYSNRCLQQVDPLQINAVLSEIGNVLKEAGYAYDCEQWNNLAKAIKKMIMDQDAITRAWVLEQLNNLRDALILKIDTDINNAKVELNLRMDGLLFECLKNVFPDQTGFQNVRPLGVGTQNGCSKIVRMPEAGPPPVFDFSFQNVEIKYFGGMGTSFPQNTPVRNTRGRTIQVLMRGSGGHSGGHNNDEDYRISFSVSKDGSTWYRVGSESVGSVTISNCDVLVPNNWYYRVNTQGPAFSSGSVVEMF